MRDKCCGNCEYADSGVCCHPEEFAGEISTDYICERYENKNIKLLKDFEQYCKKHPEQRFWQALRNWAEVDAVLIQNGLESLDTFYYERKNS